MYFILHSMMTLSHLTEPTDCIWSHVADDIQIFLLPIAKTNARDILPMCQDKFDQVTWSHLWSHRIKIQLQILVTWSISIRINTDSYRSKECERMSVCWKYYYGRGGRGGEWVTLWTIFQNRIKIVCCCHFNSLDEAYKWNIMLFKKYIQHLVFIFHRHVNLGTRVSLIISSVRCIWYIWLVCIFSAIVVLHTIDRKLLTVFKN